MNTEKFPKYNIENPIDVSLKTFLLAMKLFFRDTISDNVAVRPNVIVDNHQRSSWDCK